MNQQRFNFEQAKKERDSAIDRVEQARAKWAEIFEKAVRIVASKGHGFTTDDVLKAFTSLEQCPEKRVIGAVMRRLAAEGIIEPRGYVASDRRSSHGRPKRQWILKQ